MKVAILGESPADEEAILILVEGVYGSPVERVAGPPTLSLVGRLFSPSCQASSATCGIERMLKHLS